MEIHAVPNMITNPIEAALRGCRCIASRQRRRQAADIGIRVIYDPALPQEVWCRPAGYPTLMDPSISHYSRVGLRNT